MQIRGKAQKSAAKNMELYAAKIYNLNKSLQKIMDSIRASPKNLKVKIVHLNQRERGSQNSVQSQNTYLKQASSSPKFNKSMSAKRRAPQALGFD